MRKRTTGRNASEESTRLNGSSRKRSSATATTAGRRSSGARKCARNASDASEKAGRITAAIGTATGDKRVGLNEKGRGQTAAPFFFPETIREITRALPKKQLRTAATRPDRATRRPGQHASLDRTSGSA